jgi:DNA-binding transcriptional regulator YhcF (GntR family)
MSEKKNPADRLRDHIVSAMHLGHVRAGDRLSSIRQVAGETGADARAVARAYRTLEAEGLVEIRKRSGIYAAPQARVADGLLEETAQWAARVLVEGWKRGIAAAGLPDFFRRCCGGRRARCAFVESSGDVIAAFAHDLRDYVDVEPVWVDSLRPFQAGTGCDEAAAPPALCAADLVVTTAFHLRDVRALADALPRPLIVANVNPEMVAAVERQLRRGGLTVICADPGFGERIRTQYAEVITPETPLRVILADDAARVARLDRAEPVLLTRAARQRLGDVNLPLVFPHGPTLSVSSAMLIAEFLVRFNLAGERPKEENAERQPADAGTVRSATRVAEGRQPARPVSLA